VEADAQEMTSPAPSLPNSPKWGSTIKLIVGLTFIGMLFALVIFFRSSIGPLLLVLIVTYLLHPLAAQLTKVTKLSWKWAVNLVFLVLLILIIGLFIAVGVVVVQQIQSLIRIIQTFLSELPQMLDTLSKQTYSLGPYQLDFGNSMDLNTLSDQLIQGTQLVIGRAGSVVSTFATGAASTIGWMLFVMLIAYFTLSGIGKTPDAVQYIRIPGYEYDIRRLSRELGRIWNSFLRGQIAIVLLVIITYSVVLSILGLRYALGIALLSGLARFVPIVGTWITAIVTFLVALFQPQNYYGLDPLFFALIVVGICFMMDQVFDHYVTPRIMGDTLGINPGAVLVVTILAASFIGIVGLLIAAPFLATIKLIGQYIIRKLFDLDPWPEPEKIAQNMNAPTLRQAFQRLKTWLRIPK
jgi:predicted PurR-regulated permease PerM